MENTTKGGNLMAGGDGWHVASCPQTSQQMIIDRVMTLRFRPIAPKPADGGGFPGGISPEKQTDLLPSKRVKRKYVRVRKDDNSPRARRGNRSSAKIEKYGLDSTSKATTLQLMPEKSDGYGSSGSRSWYVIDRTVSETSVLQNWDPAPAINGAGESPDPTVVGPTHSVRGLVESWVTVECVTDMCMDVRGLGCTDVERIKNLERDTCPGFVSDGLLSKVQWVNEAYRRMVVAETAASQLDHGGGRWPEMVVWLISKAYDNNDNKKNNRNIIVNYRSGFTEGAGFTCRVRVQYMKNKKEKCWKIMPCDVWRLDCGGFAWRLDVNAALSLGL